MSDQVAALLRGQLTDIAVGSVFLFFGFACGAIALIRRRAGVRILVWLGVWSATYGAARLAGSAAFVQSLPGALQRIAPFASTAMTYLIVVPAVLAFLDLTMGALRRLLLAAAGIGLALAIAGILIFVRTGSTSALMPYNNLLAACVLLILLAALVVPRASTRYLAFHGSRVLVIGTFTFAVEALYNNLARPLGFEQYPVLDHIGFAVLLFSLAYVALELVSASERRLLAIDSELDVARKIQMAILPDGVPAMPSLRMSATCRPMTAVAGDFYAFVPVDDDRVGVLIADATGHGVPAALIASMIKVAVQAVSSCAHDPGAVLSGLNRMLYGQTPGLLISAAYLWFDMTTHTARYSAAGHPPLLRWTEGRLEPVSSNGFLLGMAEECEYPVETMEIRPGERFLLYTDGIVDVENSHGEFFGDSRLEETIRNGRALAPEAFSDELLSRIDQWRPADTPQQDDITLIVVDVV